MIIAANNQLLRSTPELSLGSFQFHFKPLAWLQLIRSTLLPIVLYCVWLPVVPRIAQIKYHQVEHATT